MPSIAASSSSVFGRLTGKKQSATQRAQEPVAIGLGDTGNIPSEGDRGRRPRGHRRESSILSLPSSVTDLGREVKRSVSLRSHRTLPSGSSTSGTSYPYKGGFPSSATLVESLSTLSTAHDGDPQTTPPVPPPPPRSRGKLSSSARSLSSKFKSSDHLPTLTHPELPETHQERPTTAIDSSRPPPTMIPAPMLPRRAPPEKPPLLPSQSFVRDVTSSHGPNGAPLQHTASTPAVPVVPVDRQNPYAVYQQIHETSAKRIATIDYLRRVHDGNIHYFGTLNYSPAQLTGLPSLQPIKMCRRANNYMILGYSLPAFLDMNCGTPLEYLRALSALLQEFETYQNLSGFDSSGSSLSRGRVGQMFSSMGIGKNSSKGRRSSTAAEAFGLTTPTTNNADHLGLPRSAIEATSPQEISPITPTGHDFNHLITPQLPFDPDFGTTFATLCDTLVDTYGKLLDLTSSPEQCGPGVGEAFSKADKSIRKILVSNVIREFEDTTRSVVKGEVAGLGRLVLGGLV